MAKLSDIQHKAIRNLLGTGCLSKCTLAINAGSAATIKTTGTTTFRIAGVPYTKAALSAEALVVNAAQQAVITGSSTLAVQPVSTTVSYVIALNSSGTVYCIQGTYADQTFTPFSTNLGTGDVPDVGDSLCPIGKIVITTDASTTFTPATTALDAAGLTVTFSDLSVIP